MTKHIVSAAQRQQTLMSLMASTQGRKRIASAVTGPLRQVRDYVSVGRRALQIDELADGALPIYDVDPEVGAFYVNEGALTIESVIKTTRLSVPLWTQAARPVIEITSVKERRFDVMKRITDKSKSQVFREEDTAVFGTLVAAGLTNAPHTVTTSAFNMDTMADAFAELQTFGDLMVEKVFINPGNSAVFRKAGRDYLDYETQREILKTGYFGSLWGAEVHQSSQVPLNTVILTAEPEYVGVMPIRIDLTILPADRIDRLQFGFVVFTHLGAAVSNPNGVKTVVLT